MENRPIPVYGNGGQIREWISVSDHCMGIWSAFNWGQNGEVYNFGSNWRLTNLETITLIAKELNMNPKIEFVKDRPGHDKRYALNSTKSLRELNWSASENTHEMFNATVRRLAEIAVSRQGIRKFRKMEKFYEH
jgi:dTDP-glucose 4,6-dehydratase